MKKETGKSASIMLSHASTAARHEECRTWHQTIGALAGSKGGIIAADLFEPIPGVQEEWVHILRYETVEQLRALLGSADFKELLESIEAALGSPVSRQIIADAGPTSAPVTVVVSQLVKPEHIADYGKWRREMDAAARGFPGFRSSETIEPVEGVQDEWIIVYRFDSAEELEAWIDSDERARMVERVQPFLDKVEFHRVGRGFEDWFGNAAGESDSRPTQWKMAMIVLLVLYPTVMLLTMLLSPLLSGWPFALAMFVSNVCSVVFLTWVAMPAATRAFRSWLAGEPRPAGWRPVYTIGLIAGLYAVLVAFFAVVTG